MTKFSSYIANNDLRDRAAKKGVDLRPETIDSLRAQLAALRAEVVRVGGPISRTLFMSMTQANELAALVEKCSTRTAFHDDPT